MKSFIILFILLSINLCSQTGSIKGKITDDNVPIPSVNILIVGENIGTVSDINGNYKINLIPVGEYELRFSIVGYETKFIDINILENQTLELNVDLNSKMIEIGEVQVTGLKQQQLSDTRTSLLDLNPRSAKILPGAGEDVLRTLQSLPGILSPNDFSSQLIVRGSGPDQNLIIMDNIEIFNPYRLYGVISMFNPDVVSDVNLISGGFPAKYGDRLSAVLDVTNREGDSKKYFSGNVNASIIDANIVLEGKNPFALNGSWLISSRRTYYDLIIEPFVKNAGLVDENVTFPNFYDLQTKFVVGPYKGHKFLFNGIYSRDGVDVVSAKNRKTADSVDINNVTKNDVLGLSWHYAPNKHLLNKFVVSWYKNSGATNFDSQVLDPSLNRDDFKDVIPDTLTPYLLNFKFDAEFSFRKYSIDDKFTYLWRENIFEAGAGVDFMQTLVKFKFKLDPELESIFSSNPQFRAVFKDLESTRNYNRYRIFAQNNFKVTDKLYLQPGLRFDYYDILDKAYIAPKFSISYALDDITTLRGAVGVYFQSPGYEKIVDQGILFDFSDRYTKQLDAENSLHYILGIERWLSSEWSLRFETYYKSFDNLIKQKQVQGTEYFTEQVPGQNPKFASGWTRPVRISGDSLTQIPTNAAFGESYGLEFFLSKKNIMNESRFSGWISYSLAWADRFEDSEKLPFRFDQRHTVNVVLNYQLNDWLDLGIRWQYGYGFPYSAPLGIKPRIILADNDLDGKPETPVIATRTKSGDPTEQEVIFNIDFGSNKLNARKPAYHRLDLRLTALTNFWNLDWAFYLDIINVYNRSNVIAYDYYVNEDLTLGHEANTMFPIVPTIGFSVKF
ncbi:MAG: TonB-dependent receptor [Ignavibacteriaceae bacterium]|nr:TonB-dependent receptor [Ignavibacteriaceae bacterium]